MLLSEGSYFIVGGAGFIGSHFVDALLASQMTRRVTIFDNFSSGREWHYEDHANDSRLKVVRADASDVTPYRPLWKATTGSSIWPPMPTLPRPPSTPRSTSTAAPCSPTMSLEAMRRSGLHRLLYASGSGVYGDTGTGSVPEDHAPLLPISTYGASKLASESLIASYCSMFGLHACAFRFGNVVGPRQTHGVGFDFLRSLTAKPKRLRILGDGNQSKPYIHVTDVVDAALCAAKKATAAFLRLQRRHRRRRNRHRNRRTRRRNARPRRQPTFDYTGGARGWRGDVPVVRLDSTRIRSLGWFPKRNSREAMRQSLQELIADARILHN